MMLSTPAPSTRVSFLEALDRLLTASGIAPLAASLDVSPRIRRVQDFVEVHVGEALCLDDLAEVAGLSRFHFSRVFRDETGQTPWSFVRDARIARAKELLAEGCTPAEAAHDAGFCDQSHLTRVLRRFEGCTPGELRDTAHQGSDRDENDGDRKIVQDN